MDYIKMFEEHEEYQEFNETRHDRPTVSKCKVQEHIHYDPFDWKHEYLQFKVITGNLSIKFSKQLEYSVNSGQTWTTLSASTSSPTLTTGKVIYLKGNLISGSGSIGIFTETSSPTSATYEIAGNVMSLLYGDDFDGKTSLSGRTSIFEGTFGAMSRLINAKNMVLPATELTTACYKFMFKNCQQLRTPPQIYGEVLAEQCYYQMFEYCYGLQYPVELPITTLAKHCYYGMYWGCTNIKYTPKLPAKTIPESAYSCMFYGCTGLKEIKEIKATAPVGQYCMYQMFYSCTALEDASFALSASTNGVMAYASMFKGCTRLRKAPKLPSICGSSMCKNMFENCTSLETAPELNVTSIGDKAYSAMFQGCTNLTTVPTFKGTKLNGSSNFESMFNGCTRLKNFPDKILPTVLTNSCYSRMFMGCTSLTNAPELPATTLKTRCYENMFHGCTSLTDAPELNAKTLVDTCYGGMFQNCSSLSSITATFNTTPGSGYTTNWVSGVASAGTFTMGSTATWDPEENRGVHGIPDDWTVETK